MLKCVYCGRKIEDGKEIRIGEDVCCSSCFEAEN